MAKACRAQGRYLEELVADRDPFWPAQVTILGAIVLYVALPEKLTLGPRWLLPSLEGLRARQPREPRLAHPPHPLLAQGRKAGGHQLILSGVLLWATNVLLFAVWYWEIDRGGPVARTLEEHPRADLLFPQMSDPQWSKPRWRPRFIDYLYTSFTNATAFSPTDTMPLTPTAKMLMLVQSAAALVTIGWSSPAR